MRDKWTSASIAGIVILLVAGGFWLRHRRPAQPPTTASSAALVTPSAVTLTGKIRASHITAVGSETAGTIDAFEADVGDEVFQGQVLAHIGTAGVESARAEAAAAVTKAQNRVEDAEKELSAAQLEASRAHADGERSRTAYDRAQKTYDRQHTLFEKGATPRLTYEKASSDFDAAQHDREIVEKAERLSAEHVQDMIKALDNAKRVLAGKSDELESAVGAVQAAVIESPVDGLIVGRKGEIGQPAQEVGADLFQIATDLYELEAVVEARPDVLKKLRPGAPALVILPDLQSTGYPGQVKSIQGTQVVVGFQSPTPAIRPGMAAEVRLKPE